MKDFNEKNSKEREKMIEVFIRIYFSMLIGLYSGADTGFFVR